MLPAITLACLMLCPSVDIYTQDGYNPPPPVEDSYNPPDGLTEAVPQPITLSTYRGMGNRASDVMEWLPLVAGHFEPEDVETALCLMAHESGGNPNAKNPNSSATGLMQIMAHVWGPEYGFSQSDFYIPEVNLYVARKVKDQQGWGAWAPYNRGECR